MNKLFQRIIFKNDSSPYLNESNMNAISKGLDDVDTRVASLASSVKTVEESAEIARKYASDVYHYTPEGYPDLVATAERADSTATTANSTANLALGIAQKNNINDFPYNPSDNIDSEINDPTTCRPLVFGHSWLFQDKVGFWAWVETFKMNEWYFQTIKGNLNKVVTRVYSPETHNWSDGRSIEIANGISTLVKMDYSSGVNVKAFLPLYDANKYDFTAGGFSVDGVTWRFNGDARMVSSITNKAEYGLELTFTGDIGYTMGTVLGKPDFLYMRYAYK